jgi:hypothetical protein
VAYGSQSLNHNLYSALSAVKASRCSKCRRRYGTAWQRKSTIYSFINKLVPAIHKRAKVHVSSYKCALGRQYGMAGGRSLALLPRGILAAVVRNPPARAIFLISDARLTMSDYFLCIVGPR